MSLAYSPGIVTNGLVFYYDMNNTQKSWRGKPTTNLVPDPDFKLQGWNTWGGRGASSWFYTTIDDEQVVYTDMSIQSNEIHHLFRDITVPAVLTTYALSIDVLVDSSVSSVFMTTEYPFGNTYGGNSYDMSKKGTWQRIYSIRDNAYSGGAPDTRMRFFFGTDETSATGRIYFRRAQMEVGTFNTPFVVGSRSNTQAVFDLVGSNTVTMTEATYENTGLLKFDGSNDYLTISNFSNKPTTQITCESWIKPTRPSVGTGTIRGGAISSTNSMYLGIIDSSDGGNTFSMHWANQTSSSRPYNLNGNIPNNQWSHLVGTYDGSVTRAYLNGVEIWSTAQSGNIPDATYVIGTYGLQLQDGVHNFNGYLGTSMIYNRGLSASEVIQNFQALRGRYGV